MDVPEMRKQVMKVFKTSTWKEKVEKMLDNEIIATYHRFLVRKLVSNI